MCDKNRHNEYGEPCMSCHTFRDKQNALIVVEKVKKLIKKVKDNPKENPCNAWFIHSLEVIITKYQRSENKK